MKDEALKVAILCEYDYIKRWTIIHDHQAGSFVVAILCEYDYIKSHHA